MKYILMMNHPGKGAYEVMSWPEEDLKRHIGFMKTFAKKLAAAGELVMAEGLGTPDQAKLIRAGKDGQPITDGVFPEVQGVPGRVLDRRRGDHRAGVQRRRRRGDVGRQPRLASPRVGGQRIAVRLVGRPPGSAASLDCSFRRLRGSGAHERRKSMSAALNSAAWEAFRPCGPSLITLHRATERRSLWVSPGC